MRLRKVKAKAKAFRVRLYRRNETAPAEAAVDEVCAEQQFSNCVSAESMNSNHHYVKGMGS